MKKQLKLPVLLQKSIDQVMEYHKINKNIAELFLNFCEDYSCRKCFISNINYQNNGDMLPPYVEIKVGVEEIFGLYDIFRKNIEGFEFIFYFPENMFDRSRENSFYINFLKTLKDNK